MNEKMWIRLYNEGFEMCRMQKKEEGMNMKEEAIKKINKIGKVSSVFALIGKIVIGMSMVLLLVSAIVCFFMPKDLATITIDEKVGFTLNLDTFGEKVTEEDVEAMRKDFEESVEAEMEKEEVHLEEVLVTEDKLETVSSVPTYSFTLRDLAWVMLVLALNVTMIMVTLCFISSLCKAFRDCESPFEENVVKKMRNLAFSLIPWAVFSSITNSVANSLLQNRVSVNLTVDLGVIMIVLVVFMMVHIFKYGAMLQQESDETL
ncbi:MAG: DUF2975 domain-containing protein [Lachnospiraceae bacterium]|nr:DUF2975 domain-containing protein [Lachnospiraceae bacterium]